MSSLLFPCAIGFWILDSLLRERRDPDEIRYRCHIDWRGSLRSGNGARLDKQAGLLCSTFYYFGFPRIVTVEMI